MIPAPEIKSLNGEVSSTIQTTKRSLRNLAEIAVAFLLILLALWTENPTQKLLAGLTLLWIAGATLQSRQSAGALGLRLSGLGRSLWIIGAALLFAAIAVVTARRFHT